MSIFLDIQLPMIKYSKKKIKKIQPLNNNHQFLRT